MFFAQQFVIIISRHSNAVLATLQLVHLFERRAIIISLQQQSCCCCNSTQLGSSGVVRYVPLIHLMWWFVVLLVLLQLIKKLYRDSFNISLFFEFKGPLSRDCSSSSWFNICLWFRWLLKVLKSEARHAKPIERTEMQMFNTPRGQVSVKADAPRRDRAGSLGLWTLGLN